MKVPFVDLYRIHLDLMVEIEDKIKEVIKESAFIQGERVAEFERNWAEYNGAKFAIGCSNGTSALELALKSLDVGRGDEVITVSNTFFATVEAIYNVGAKPVVVDIQSSDGLMDLSLVEDKITERTKAILPVHLYGQMVDMEALSALAKKHNLFVIEDSAQAHGASFNGKPPGYYSLAACFSFYPGKNLGAFGDAGAIVTNNEELALRARSLRDHGRSKKYEHKEFGFNQRLDALQAVLLNCKLKHLDQWLQDRRKTAKIYYEALSMCSGIVLPRINEDINAHAFHLFVLLTDKRDALLNQLKERGVGVGIHYPIPCHLQPAWIKEYGRESLPFTEKWASSVLSLPIFGGIKEEEVLFVVDQFKEAVKAIF